MRHVAICDFCAVQHVYADADSFHGGKMVSSARLVVAIFIAVVLSGCGALSRGYSVKPLTGKSVENYRKLVEALTDPEGGQLLPVQCFATSATDSDCRAKRNNAVAALIIASEELCLAHRRSIYANDAVWNVTSGTLTNLFAGAASVVTNEKNRPIFAALALFSNSERSLVNESVYKQMLATAVDKKIVENRQAQISAINVSLANDLSKYSVNAALVDVIRLHDSCSFMDGLQRALDEGTQTSPDQKIAKLRTRLAALTKEYSLLDAKDKTTPVGTNLGDRIKAVTEALKAEEVR